MFYLAGRGFLAIVGYFYLLGKYKDRKVRSKILELDYKGSYADAGGEVYLNGVGLLWGIFLLLLILTPVIAIAIPFFRYLFS